MPGIPRLWFGEPLSELIFAVDHRRPGLDLVDLVSFVP